MVIQCHLQSNDCLPIIPLLVHQQSWCEADSGKYGGPPLSTESKKQIIHLFFNMLMTPEEIAPLIESPRNPALVFLNFISPRQ